MFMYNIITQRLRWSEEKLDSDGHMMLHKHLNIRLSSGAEQHWLHWPPPPPSYTPETTTNTHEHQYHNKKILQEGDVSVSKMSFRLKFRE